MKTTDWTKGDTPPEEGAYLVAHLVTLDGGKDVVGYQTDYFDADGWASPWGGDDGVVLGFIAIPTFSFHTPVPAAATPWTLAPCKPEITGEKEEIRRKLRKFDGAPPYDVESNTCQGNPFYAKSLVEEHGAPIGYLRSFVAGNTNRRGYPTYANASVLSTGRCSSCGQSVSWDKNYSPPACRACGNSVVAHS